MPFFQKLALKAAVPAEECTQSTTTDFFASVFRLNILACGLEKDFCVRIDLADSGRSSPTVDKTRLYEKSSDVLAPSFLLDEDASSRRPHSRT